MELVFVMSSSSSSSDSLEVLSIWGDRSSKKSDNIIFQMPCTNKGIYRIDIFVLFADCLSVSQSVCLSGLFFKEESSVKLACLNLYSHDLHA